MVQLKSRKEGSFELTDRDRTVKLEGASIQLDEQTFDQPGEYEVEGIEIVYGTQAALLVWEKLQIVYLFQGEKPTSFEKSQFAPCNVLLVGSTVEGLDKPKVTELLETYDPNIVAFSSTANTEQIQDALKIDERDVLKLTESALPAEGRELYRLTG